MRTRAPTSADHDRLVELINHAALAGEAELEPRSRPALVSELTSPQIDGERDLRVWCDPTGAIRAFARLRIEPSAETTSGRLHYAIGDARDLDLEPAVIDWAAGRLREAAPAPRRLVHAIAVRDPDRAGRLAALGFVPHRVRHSMARALATELPAAPLPAGYRIRPGLGAPDADGYVAAFNEAFADAHDFSPLTIAEFHHDNASPGYRPEHDLVLETADGAIAGFCFVAVDDEQPRLAYVGAVGVRRAHRRLGLGASLLVRALAQLRDDGITDVHLHVDSDSPTGAPRLYQRLGFAVRYVEIRHVLDEPRLSR